VLLFPAPGPPQLSSDKPAATTRGDTRREEGAIRYAHKMMHSPATRTTYPYPHDVSVSARRSLTYHHLNMPRDPVPASAPPLVDPHTARDPIPFAYEACLWRHWGGSWFRCLALVSVASVPCSRAVPCYLRRVPSTQYPAGAWLSPPLAPQSVSTI